MFFALSKIGFFFLRPSNALIILLILGCFLLFSKRRILARFVIVTAVVLLVALGFSPLSHLLIEPLEQRFPPPGDVQTVDGIVILGGSFVMRVGGSRGSVEFNEAAERLTVVPALAARYPDAKIVFSGGSGILFSNVEHSEADIAARLFSEIGVDMSRVILEDKSRNTWENAELTSKKAMPGAGETWLLVTSAFHMPRAIGCFRSVGWRNLIAYPVDFRVGRGDQRLMPSGSASEGLRRSDIAVREWIGLTVYYLTGRIEEWFPAP